MLITLQKRKKQKHQPLWERKNIQPLKSLFVPNGMGPTRMLVIPVISEAGITKKSRDVKSVSYHGTNWTFDYSIVFFKTAVDYSPTSPQPCASPEDLMSTTFINIKPSPAP